MESVTEVPADMLLLHVYALHHTTSQEQAIQCSHVE